jgi:hypothetical protein
MPMQSRRLKIGFALAAVALVCGLAAQPSLAEDAAPGAHGDGHASPPSGESGSARPPGGADAGAGETRRDGHTLHDDGKNREGVSPGGNETVRDVQPATPGGKDAGAIDTSLVPSRRLDRRLNNIGEAKTTIESATENLHRRMLSVSPTPDRPIRNAIGVPVPAHQGVERNDGVHPGALAVPHASSGGATTAPGGVGSHFTGTEATVDHRAANPNPVVAPAMMNRGAISGTGLAHRNAGSSQIGGPKASVAGINGTTIRPKR